MSDQRALYTEEAVGAGHPSKSDVMNRLALVEHSNEGTHVNTVTAKTADYTLVAADCTGLTTFTNDGASGDVILTLPTAVAGYRIPIIVAETQYLFIAPSSGDTIRVDSSTATSTDAFYSNTIGDNTELIAINSTEWIALDQEPQFSILTGRGFILGGLKSGVSTDEIERLYFGSEANAIISATLDTATSKSAGCESSTKGYALGGVDAGGLRDVIEQITFSDESSAAIVATLDTAKGVGAGCNSSLKGYILGGLIVTPAYINVIEQITFSDETSAAIAATLDTAKGYFAGCESSLKGYVFGGTTAASPPPVDVIEQITFSNESSAAIAATLDTARDELAACNSSTKGYTFGGGSDVIEQITFSDESSAAIAATLSVSNNQVEAYEATIRGYSVSGNNGTQIEHLVFANESCSVIDASLAVAKNFACACNT